jgi:hypothetical protein
MWLNVLSSPEMVSLTGKWIDPKALRPTFLSIPELAPQMPHVEEAHNALLSGAAENQAGEDLNVANIEKQEKATDKRFDHATRAILHMAVAFREASLAKDPPSTEDATHAATVVTELMPLKGKTVSLTYQAEAGTTKVAATFLGTSPDAKKLLARMRIDETTSGMDLVGLWMELGGKLDALEATRTMIESAATDPANMSTVRNRWTAVVRTVLSILDSSKAPAAAVQKIRGPVEEATDKALARVEGRRRARAGAPPAEPASPGPA